MDQIESQLRTKLIGSMIVTRAVLPVMRQQHSGHIISISSGAGISGFEFNTAYAASKFGLEGWMESLHPEVLPFGIHTTIVNPGMFRTELLTKESAIYANPSIEDYSESRTRSQIGYESQNGKQAGDPTKLAAALISISNEELPPLRFIAGADAVGIAEQKIELNYVRTDQFVQRLYVEKHPYPAWPSTACFWQRTFMPLWNHFLSLSNCTHR